ncbi:MAG TPA: choice-of-anchor D domain-containing protein [Desulfobacteraceae bacterium]|nr:choice-of-anchor D domain-containing protein [Desulfobacteraceae bacterium]
MASIIYQNFRTFKLLILFIPCFVAIILNAHIAKADCVNTPISIAAGSNTITGTLSTDCNNLYGYGYNYAHYSFTLSSTKKTAITLTIYSNRAWFGVVEGTVTNTNYPTGPYVIAPDPPIDNPGLKSATLNAGTYTIELGPGAWPNGNYNYRLSVSTIPPTATTTAATDLGLFSGTLNGTVDDNDAGTTVSFEYGTTTGYGSSTGTVGTIYHGDGSSSFSRAVSNLECETTYHYRIVATNAIGTSYGADQTFTTTGSCPTYTVSTSAGDHGDITPASVIVKHGRTTSFNVLPDTGYHTSSVTGCVGSLDGDTYTTGPVTSACTVTANFAINTYTVSTSAGVGGTIDPASRIVDHGLPASFTITPDPGYSISSVTGCDGTLDGDTYTTGAITGPCTVTATFVYLKEIEIKGNGNLILDGDTSPSVDDDTDFGSVDVISGTNANTFTIENLGGGTLSLTGSSPYVSITGHTSDFTLTSTPLNSISAGSSTSFEITFNPTAGGTRSASISIANDDSDENPYNFDIQGTGIYIAPTTQAHTVTFSNVKASQMTIGWTNGSGANRAVFLYQGSSGTASPVDNTTYTAHTEFKAGTQIGATGWYCIYNGTGSSVAVIGLMPGSTYRAMVCEYNGTAGYESYVTDTASDNPANQPMDQIMINEVDADTPGSDVAEFIELYDGGTGNVSLDGLVVVFYDGATDLSYNSIDLDGYSTDANGYFVMGNSGVSGVDLTFPNNTLQDGTDAVALYVGNGTNFPNGTALTTTNLVDAVVYDTDDPDDAALLALILSGGQVNENARGNSEGHSNQRIPNGTGGLRSTSTYDQQPPTPDAQNYAYPEIISATYDYSTNQLVVTGAHLVANTGAYNDVSVSMLTFTGEGGGTYTLSSTGDVEITSSTQFSVTLSGMDIPNVESLLNKDGTSSYGGTTYNLAAADNWMTGSPSADDISDPTNGITVSNYAIPVITSATYDAATGQLAAIGTNFVLNPGATNDVDASLFTFTGQGGGTYTLTNTSDVDIASSTQFTLILSATDKPDVNGLLNKNGTQSSNGVTYNLATADNWMPGSPAGNNIADATTGITVSNVPVPAITSAAYDYSTNVLTVTGTDFISSPGAANDVDVTKLTVTGEGGGTCTLASSGNVEITSSTEFSVTITGSDLPNVEALLNKDGTSSYGGTTYNLAAAEDWMTAADPLENIADLTGNGITVSNYANPAITSAAYDANTGQMVLTGTNLVAESGAANDIDASLLTITGEGSNSYQLTDTPDVDLTSASSFTVTLSAEDRLHVNGLLNKNGSSSADATAYNLAAADNWATGAPEADNIEDLTGNPVTVGNVQIPTITSATYDSDTGVFVVTGTNLFKKPGALNDIDVTKFTVTGEGGNYTISDAIADVEITSATEFTFTVTGTDKTQVDLRLDLFGTQSSGGMTYNLAAAEDWLTAADPAANIADLSNNGITVSISPKIASATYDASTGVLVVTGTNIQENAGGSDIDASKFTLKGEGDSEYTLTNTPDVNRTSASQFTLTLSVIDRAAANQIMNRNGTASTGGTVYNLAAADDWCTNVTDGNTDDLNGNAITVTDVPVPTITSATYNATTGVLVVTGTGMLKKDGALNDIDVSMLSITGEGNETYQLTDTADVEITSGTEFTIVLNATDKNAVNMIINKNGTTSTSGTTYNLAAAEDWAAGADPAINDIDATGNPITASNVSVPVITTSSYHWSNGILTATGTGFLKKEGANNDIDASKFTFRGEGGGTYTLLGSPDVDITSGTEFSIILDATDKAEVNLLLNEPGTSSIDNTVYNLAAAEDWATGADPAVNVVDATTPITASGFSVTISGTVTDGTNPIQGATITFSHDSHTETTAADGTYSYTVPGGITTTVTPSHTGYGGWNPANRTYTNISADQPNQDFQGTINTYTISGTITDGVNPIEGVTITFSHNGHTETTAADGTYSYTVDYNTTTTITPSHSGYGSWNPADRTVNNISANQPGQDFHGTINTYTISGTVTDGVNPIQGATITFSHNGHTENTAADGTYSYTVDYNTTTTITPSHAGYGSWTPADRTVNNISADQPDQDFSSTSDTDGVPAQEESGPDGNDPSYDGNGDGVPDNNQPNVVSFHTEDGNNYVTLAAPDGTIFADVHALPSPAPGIFPELLSFPYGMFSFTLTGVTPGGAAQVVLFLSGEASIDSYWKYGREPGDETVHPYEFMLADGTGAEIIGNTIVLHFIDGEKGDDGLIAEGTIVDDGGPGATSTVIPALSNEGMIALVILLSFFAFLMIRRRRI